MGQKASLGNILLSLLIRHLSPCPGSIHSLGRVSVMINFKDSCIAFPGFCLLPVQFCGRGLPARKSVAAFDPVSELGFQPVFPLRTGQTSICVELWSVSPTVTLVLLGNASEAHVTHSAIFSWFPWSVGLSDVLIKQTLEHHHFPSDR